MLDQTVHIEMFFHTSSVCFSPIALRKAKIIYNFDLLSAIWLRRFFFMSSLTSFLVSSKNDGTNGFEVHGPFAVW